MNGKPIVQRPAPTVITTVEIDEDCYRVQAVPNGIRFRKLDGQREGATYTVWIMTDGAPQCDCPDAQYRKRACKHTLALKVMGYFACRASTNESSATRPLAVSPGA